MARSKEAAARKLVADAGNGEASVLNRRALLGRAAAGLAVVAAGAIGCKKAPLVCDGMPGIAPADVVLRTTLEYKDTSLAPDKTCDKCSLYVVAQENGGCGTCKVVRGPINPLGTCKVFLRKLEGGAPT